MATKIIHKKSSVASNVPSPASIEPGEIAINLADQKIYSKTTGGTVIELGSGSNFTAADEAKLDGIETGATADQTKADIDALNIDADKLDGLHASSFLRSNAADTATGDLTFEGNVTFNGVSKGIYHAVEEDHYYFDDYSGARNAKVFLDGQRSDIIRYREITSVEYWNGTAWVDGSSQLNNIKKLLDGRRETSWAVPSTYYKFRFNVTASTGWPTTTLIGMQTSWSGSTFPGCTMLVEEQQADTSWQTKVTADFNSGNGVTTWGTMFRADGALHTGRGNQTGTTRITIDFDGWTPSNPSHTTIPLLNVFIFSNYAGSENTGISSLLDYERNLSVDGSIFVNGTVDGRDVAADGTKLDGIESGATADQTKADIDALNVDADTLDGQHGSYYQDWTNTTNKPDPTITLAGDLSGAVTLTDLGSGTLTATVADDSHNHVISNVDGLQTALDGKLSTSGKAADSNLLDGLDSGSFLRSDANDNFSGTLNYTPDTGTIIAVDGQPILKRYTTNGGIGIGHDDMVMIAAGDTMSTIEANVSEATEQVVLAAEGGWRSFAFPGNNTSWSNRKETYFTGDTFHTDGNITTAGTVDGRDVATDGSKLDGIESGATADQTKADIDALNIDADTLDGQHGSYYTGYADTAVANLVASAPTTLDTLNELAAALGDDPNFATTMTNSLAGKVDDSQVLTNVPAGAVFTDTTYSIGNGGLTEINFTSALNSKLSGIESGATADQTKADIDALNVDADTLDGQHGSYYQNAGNLNAGTLLNARLNTNNRYYTVDPAIPTHGNLDSHLGMPSVAQAAIQKGYIENKTQFCVPIAEYSTDGGTVWVDAGFSSSQLKDLVKGRYTGSSIVLERTWTNVRFRWTSPGFPNGYVFLNALYLYTSTRGNSVSNLKIEAKDFTAQTWATYSDGNSFSSWPGHQWIPHSSIPFTASAGRKDEVVITLDLNFSHATNKINIHCLDWFGSYPAARQQTAWSWDRDKNLLTTTALPFSGSTYDIGSSGVNYRHGYFSGNLTVGGTVDGRDVATDGTKLDGIESGATADQTKSDIDALNVDADTVDGLHAASFVRSDADDIKTGLLDFHRSDTQTIIQSGNSSASNADQFFIKHNLGSVEIGNNRGDINFTSGSLRNDGSLVFSDAYHPNADKLTTARTISLSGDVTGSTSFDGTGNVSITATVADDSHNHTIANVDGLQTALDGKLSTTGKAADSELLDGINGADYFRQSAVTNLLMNNYNISGVNALTFNDPGPSEGLAWSGGNIKVFESPDDIATNTAGNLQVTYGGTRKFTVNNSGIDVVGNVQHQGLTMTSGTDIDQLYTATLTYTAGTGWTDTGINGADLATGSYMVQVHINDTNGHQYDERYTGVMSWLGTNTNDTSFDEIALHSAGHADNDKAIYLRTIRTVDADTDNMKLQISASYTGVSTTVTLKFRRMI